MLALAYSYDSIHTLLNLPWLLPFCPICSIQSARNHLHLNLSFTVKVVSVKLNFSVNAGKFIFHVLANRRIDQLNAVILLILGIFFNAG